MTSSEAPHAPIIYFYQTSSHDRRSTDKAISPSVTVSAVSGRFSGVASIT